MVVAWIYGVSNIVRDLEFMLKTKFSAYLKICWGLIAPLSLLTILVYNLYNFTPLDSSKYPPVAIGNSQSMIHANIAFGATFILR